MNTKPSPRSNSVSVTFGGRKRKIHLNMLGIHRAMMHGYDVAQLDESGAVKAEEKDMTLEQKAKAYEATNRMLWIGLLPYDADITFEDMLMSISFSEMQTVQDALRKAVELQGGEAPDPIKRALRKKPATKKKSARTAEEMEKAFPE